MADLRNATLTLNCTAPRATVATVPAARTTQTEPSVRGAGRISSAMGTGKPALPATVVLLVSDSLGLLRPDGLGDKRSISCIPRK